MATIAEDYASDFEYAANFDVSGIPRLGIEAASMGLSSSHGLVVSS